MIKKNLVIITSGISVTNDNNELAKYFSSVEDVELSNIKWEMAKIVEENPKLNLGSPVSAEVTVINSMLNSKLIEENSRLIIVHSETKKGIVSAHIIKEFLAVFVNEMNIELRPIANLNMESSDLHSVHDGLFTFITDLKTIFEENRSNKEYLIFSPIGGYKSMTTISYLVASMNGIECYYQFESNSMLLNLPLIPVVEDFSYLEEEPYFSVIQKFLLHTHFKQDEELSSEEISVEFSNQLEEFDYEFYKLRDENLTLFYLSPLFKDLIDVEKFYPHFYFERSIAPSDKKQFYNSFISEWALVNSQTAREAYNDVFKHEKGLKGVSKSSYNWHVFRTSRVNYGNNLRSIYRIDENESKIFVKDIYKHEEYDRIIEKGILEKRLSEDSDVDKRNFIKY